MVSDSSTAGVVLASQEITGFRFLDVVHRSRQDRAEHQHRRASLNLVLCGSYPEQCRNREMILFPAGSLIYKPPQQPHSNQFTGKPVRSLVVELCTPMLDELQRQSDELSQSWSLHHPETSYLAQRLFVELHHPITDSSEVVAEITTALLDAVASSKSSKSRRSPNWLNKSLAEIDSEFTTSLTIEQLANTVCVCRTHYARAFRQVMGCTPGEFIRGRRVALSLELLSHSSLTGVEIATLSGFSDESHMIRIIRRALGYTPSVIRKTLRS